MTNLTSATAIARTYMVTHDGQMPLMVIGYNAEGESIALLGNFRKKHELDDQKTFCAILRMAFIANRITEYFVLAQSRMLLLDEDVASAKLEEIGSELPEDQTVPVLIVVGVSEFDRMGRIFQLTDGDRVDLVSVMDIDAEDGTIEGMFMQLLPEKSATLPANVLQGIEYYVNQIRYIAPVIEEPVAVVAPTGLSALFSNFNA